MTGLSYKTMPREEDVPVPVRKSLFDLAEIKREAARVLQDAEFLERDEEAIDEPGTSSGPGFDPRGFVADLYTELRPHLYRYVTVAYGLGSDQTIEIIQETFTRLMAQMISGDKIENPRGWSVRVARNLAISHLRECGHRGDGTHEAERALMTDRADPSLNQEQRFLKHERVECLNKALRSISPRHRSIFLMRSQGLRYSDIAESMDVTIQRAAEIVKLVATRLAVICG